jgi:hypothetical protein
MLNGTKLAAPARSNGIRITFNGFNPGQPFIVSVNIVGVTGMSDLSDSGRLRVV